MNRTDKLKQLVNYVVSRDFAGKSFSILIKRPELLDSPPYSEDIDVIWADLHNYGQLEEAEIHHVQTRFINHLCAIILDPTYAIKDTCVSDVLHVSTRSMIQEILQVYYLNCEVSLDHRKDELLERYREGALVIYDRLKREGRLNPSSITYIEKHYLGLAKVIKRR